MNHTGGTTSVSGGGWRHVLAIIAACAIFLLLAFPAAAQEDDESGGAIAGGKNGAKAFANDGCAVAEAGDLVVEAGCDEKESSGGEGGENDADGQQQNESDPLSGEEARISNTNGGGFADRIEIPVKGCQFEEDATVTLEDQDGTEFEISNSENDFETDQDGIVITGPDGEDIVVENARNLGAGTGEVIESSGITCGENAGGNPGGNNGDGGNGDPGDNNGDGNTNDDDPGNEGNQGTEDNPLPADDEAGPLEGAEAIGKDIDVEGDIIGNDPETGEPVEGIDTITIKTTNCEVTDRDDLSVTLDIIDGGPGRFIDGAGGGGLDNAEITVDQDQVTIRGQGPKNVVEPFFVEGQAQPGDIFVQSNFRVISSTGIGGEGCQAVKAANDSGGRDDVVDGTVPNKELPQTGGPGFLIPLAALLLASGAILLARRRP